MSEMVFSLQIKLNECLKPALNMNRFFPLNGVTWMTREEGRSLLAQTCSLCTSLPCWWEPTIPHDGLKPQNELHLSLLACFICYILPRNCYHALECPVKDASF